MIIRSSRSFNVFKKNPFKLFFRFRLPKNISARMCNVFAMIVIDSEFCSSDSQFVSISHAEEKCVWNIVPLCSNKNKSISNIEIYWKWFVCVCFQFSTWGQNDITVEGFRIYWFVFVIYSNFDKTSVESVIVCPIIFEILKTKSESWNICIVELLCLWLKLFESFTFWKFWRRIIEHEKFQKSNWFKNWECYRYIWIEQSLFSLTRQ